PADVLLCPAQARDGADVVRVRRILAQRADRGGAVRRIRIAGRLHRQVPEGVGPDRHLRRAPRREILADSQALAEQLGTGARRLIRHRRVFGNPATLSTTQVGWLGEKVHPPSKVSATLVQPRYRIMALTVRSSNAR